MSSSLKVTNGVMVEMVHTSFSLAMGQTQSRICDLTVFLWLRHVVSAGKIVFDSLATAQRADLPYPFPPALPPSAARPVTVVSSRR
jgi:hypothetical protein